MKTTINNLSVFTSGNTNNKSIIFVHGFPFDHRMWDAQIEALSEDYCYITYDIRGLGESPAGDGQFTMESFVDDLETIIDELKLNLPVLCGLSMGGYISLRAMERMEKRFRALILCDTKALADDNAGKIKRAEGIKSINENGVENFVGQFVPNCFSDNFMMKNKPGYEEVLIRSKSSSPIGVKGGLLAMAGRTDTTAFLPNILIPTLVICGEEDKLTPPDVMKSMADQINNSEFHVIDRAGHMAPLEAADIVNEKMRSFLAEYSEH
jgi:pimeloyl-ACP methyl ester carboxylesterase